MHTPLTENGAVLSSADGASCVVECGDDDDEEVDVEVGDDIVADDKAGVMISAFDE